MSSRSNPVPPGRGDRDPSRLGPDQRGSARVDTFFVRGRTNQRSPLRVVNASASGLCFETPERLPVRGPLRLRLDLAGGESIVTGRIIWCRMVSTHWADSSAAVYQAGVALDGGQLWREDLLGQIKATDELLH